MDHVLRKRNGSTWKHIIFCIQPDRSQTCRVIIWIQTHTLATKTGRATIPRIHLDLMNNWLRGSETNGQSRVITSVPSSSPSEEIHQWMLDCLLLHSHWIYLSVSCKCRGIWRAYELEERQTRERYSNSRSRSQWYTQKLIYGKNDVFQ